MNPTQPESGGISLPTPEQAVVMPQVGEKLPAGETAAAPERTGAAPLTTSPLAVPIPLPGAQPAGITVTSPTTTSDTSLMTDDDLIEKEWVNKAKQIVERTRDDPHKQSEVMTVFKADYIKKHYGKTIKLSR